MSRFISRLYLTTVLCGAAACSLAPIAALGQLPSSLSRFGTIPESSLFDRPSSKVLNILPISHFSVRQDPVTSQDIETQQGQLLPGLESSQELVIPQDQGNEPESLPDSRESKASDKWGSSISWVGLNNRAKPKSNLPEGNARVGGGRSASAPLSRTFRRPSPPAPVIAPFQPAIVHIPVQIQVVPMYVDHYHYWPTGFDFPGGYFGTPSVVPPLPPAPVPYGGSAVPPPSVPLSTNFGIDRRLHVPTDQRMQYISEVNLVGNVSNSINFVSYPLNHHSYPANRVYGVQVQTFPVHRRLP
ncbi:MAG: hypothetical protein JNL67_20690 [Planctomycetaceae bacterium]|nr:hypothetical protein [Planctomycetaceae bacterium]